jgi:hypothetical protein
MLSLPFCRNPVLRYWQQKMAVLLFGALFHYEEDVATGRWGKILVADILVESPGEDGYD